MAAPDRSVALPLQLRPRDLYITQVGLATEMGRYGSLTGERSVSAPMFEHAVLQDSGSAFDRRCHRVRRLASSGVPSQIFRRYASNAGFSLGVNGRSMIGGVTPGFVVSSGAAGF